MSHQQNIREYVVSFMSEHSSSRFDLFEGIPLRDVVRNRFVLSAQRPALFLSDARDVSPTSWREYLRHMSHDAEADSIAARAAALLFKVQIILVDTAQEFHVINPDVGLRRIFLLYDPTHCIGWLCPEELNNQDVLFGSRTFTISPASSLINFNRPLPANQLGHRSQRLERQMQIRAAHCGLTGHPGIEATLILLRDQNNKWRGMTRDVKTFIRNCPTCALTRSHHTAALANASRLRVSDRPLSRWHCDHVSFSKCKLTGFKAICLFVDEVTGFTWLAGSKFKSALETAVTLMLVSALFGTPADFHSDGGGEFDNCVLQQFCAMSGMKHSFGIPNNPNTRGIAERNVALTTHILRTICVSFGNNDAWGLFIPLAMRAINHLPRSCLNGLAPSQFVFAGLHDYSPDVFAVNTPSAFNPFLRADIPANVPASFTERAIYAQEVVASAVCEYHDARFAAACAADDETPPE